MKRFRRSCQQSYEYDDLPEDRPILSQNTESSRLAVTLTIIKKSSKMAAYAVVGASLAALVTAVIFTGGIRKNAYRALAAYKKARLTYLAWTGGRTEASEAEQRVISGKVWEDWCDALKAANAALVAPGCPMVSLVCL